MSTDGSLPQPIIASASLSSLPIEIKSLIVQYAYLQDESYQQRKNSSDDITSELTVNILNVNKMRGHSLNALFLVDSCFSNLCAVYLFKNIDKLSKRFFTFKHSIALQRGSLVKEVVFDGLDKDQLRDLLFVAHGFLNVGHLVLHSSSLRLLLGDLSVLGNSGDDELDGLYHSFQRLAGKISSLDLYYFSISDLSAVVNFFPVLKSLSIQELGIFSLAVEEQESIRSLGVVLSNYPLEHLSLYSPVVFVVPKSWLDLDWVSSGTLKVLDIKADELDSTILHLISKFSSLLERINLAAAIMVFNQEFSFAESFNNLKVLRLEISSKEAKTNYLLKLFSGSPLLQLVIETVDWSNIEDVNSLINTLVPSLSLYPTLQSLIICDRFIHQEVFASLVHLCASLKITLQFTHWEIQYVGIQFQEDGWPFDSSDKLLFYEPALVSALKYGERKLLTLKKEKDVAGMKEMFKNCKWLRASAAEMMD